MGGYGLNREDVIKAFGLKEFQKGLAYYSDGSVLMAVEENGIVRGKVQGSMDRPYDVKIDLNDLLDSTCTCPVEDMCKHCAALAIAYADGKVTGLSEIESRVDGLSEKEAKSLLVRAAMQSAAVARDVLKGPKVCTWLGSRLGTVSNAFDGCRDVEDLSEGCDKLHDLIEGSRGSDTGPDNVLQLSFAIASEALDALDEVQEDPYEDLRELILGDMELFGEAIDKLADDGLDDAFEEAMALFGRDWEGIGLENMPLYFSSRFGADRVIDRFQEEVRKNGRASRRIKEIGIRRLSYQAHMAANDTEGAVQILLGDGASEDDRVLAATTLVLQEEWGKARDILEPGEWTSRKRERTHMLLSIYFHQGPAIEPPPARDIMGLIRNADGRIDDRMREMVLNVLRRTGDDDTIGTMVARSDLPVMTKTWLLARLGRWDEFEREVRGVRSLGHSDLWKLAEIVVARKDICTVLVLRALACKGQFIPQEGLALVKIAFQNMGREDLRSLEGVDLIGLRIDVLVAQELAPRFPEDSLRLLKERAADMDPQRLADLMFLLQDRRSSYDLGMTWLRRKLTVSPRYDRIRAALLAMRCLLSDDEWQKLNDSLCSEFPGRAALKGALTDIEIMKQPAINTVPAVWNRSRIMNDRNNLHD